MDERFPVQQRLYPLSTSQERIWLSEQLEPESARFNNVVCSRLPPDVDPDRLKLALKGLCRAYKSVTVNIVERGNALGQVADEANCPPLEVISAGQGEIWQLLAREASKRFNLSEAPLLRCLLFCSGSKSLLVAIIIHELICDGFSQRILMDGLERCYHSDEMLGLETPQPHVGEDPFLQYCRWEREEWLGSGGELAGVEYWAGQLKDLAGSLMPIERRDSPLTRCIESERSTVSLGGQVVSGLQELSGRASVTPFIIGLSAFAIALSQHVQGDEVLMTFPVSGRSRPEMQALVGCFLNFLPLRLRIRGDDTLVGCLEQARLSLLSAFAHQNVALERHITKFRGADGTTLPLSKIVVSSQDLRIGSTDGDPERWQSVPYTKREDKFELSLYITTSRHEWSFSLEANLALYPPGFCETLLTDVVETLKAYPAFLNRKLSSLWSRRSMEHSETNRAYALVSNADIVDELRSAFRAHENRVALSDDEGSLTYRELDLASDNVARKIALLLGAGALPRVGIYLPQTRLAVVAIIGVLKANALYVPIDDGNPISRVRAIIEDAELSLLISDGRPVAADLKIPGVRCVDLADLLEEDTSSGAIPKHSEEMAYIIFTSGTTGRPKGVLQTRAAVAHYARVLRKNISLSPHDNISMLASYAYDAAVMDIFTAFTAGAHLHVGDIRQNGLADLGRWLERHAITVWHTTPTVFRLIAASNGAHCFRSVRCVLLGGEEAKADLLEEFKRITAPEAVLINGYGPTEATIIAQGKFTHSSTITESSLPLGKPVDGIDILLVDEVGRRSLTYGEICVESPFLSPGYVGNPRLTNARFPRLGWEGEGRRYLTGDLGRWLPDGKLTFLGRVEGRLKVRGHLVEKADVENTLRTFEGVKHVVVQLRDDIPEGELIAYVVLDTFGSDSVTTLRKFLRERLPSYMVPTRIRMVKSIPVTPNGKVNLRELAAVPEEEDSTISEVEQLTPVELAIRQLFEKHTTSSSPSKYDSFFDLGGHSLSAMQLVRDVAVLHGVQITLRTLFDSPTVFSIANIVAEASAAKYLTSAVSPD